MLPIYCNSSLNRKDINKDPQRMTKIKPFIDKYNWKGISSTFEQEKNGEKLFIDCSKCFVY